MYGLLIRCRKPQAQPTINPFMGPQDTVKSTSGSMAAGVMEPPWGMRNRRIRLSTKEMAYSVTVNQQPFLQEAFLQEKDTEDLVPRKGWGCESCI